MSSVSRSIRRTISAETSMKSPIAVTVPWGITNLKWTCQRCDGRGWYFTPSSRRMGAVRCACGAKVSEIGEAQISARGGGQ